MTALEEFIHHGTLPFVGRSVELERLLEFWRATPHAQRLRAAILQAEAGIGKSRLVEVVGRRVAAEEGMVIHVKFYPESSLSLSPLLAPALWQSNVGRELLRSEPEGTLPSVIAALRRLCRLRPTLLILEDTHLLPVESTPELASLLNALADETLSVLCLCRPTEWKGRTVVEGFLVERIELEGLTEEAIVELWEGLFGGRCERGIAGLLRQATLGNCLALRSGLRSAIDAGVIARVGDTWRMRNPSNNFGEHLKRNVELLSAGMVAHLSPEELMAAGQFACLGEVFAREAAETLLEEAPRLIDSLLRAGVLAATATVPAPLGGVPPAIGRSPGPTFPASAHPPLVFTHTLLHKHLSEHAAIDPEALVALIAANAPLYSLLPFLLLQHHGGGVTPTTEGIVLATERALYIAWLLDQAFDNHSGFKAWTTSMMLFDRFKESLSASERQWWRLRLLQVKISLVRFISGAERRECAREFYEATLTTEDVRMIPYRLTALSFYVGTHYHMVEELQWEVWRELERIIEESPTHRFHRSYIKCVASVTQVAEQVLDYPLLEKIRRRVDGLLAEAGPEERRMFEWLVLCAYLPVFSTHDELEDRRRLLERAQGEGPNDGRITGVYRARFLAHIGAMDAAFAEASAITGWLREQGIWERIVQVVIDGLVAQAALGRDLAEVEGEIRRLMQDAPQDLDVSEAVTWGAVIGLLRGDTAWSEAIVRGFEGGGRQLWAVRFLLAIARGELAAARELAHGDWRPQLLLDREAYETLRRMLAVLVGDEIDGNELIDRIETLLRRPVLRLSDLLWGGAIVRLLGLMRISSVPAGFVSLGETASAAVLARLEWLAERGLASLMAPLLESAADHLSPTERALWNEEIVRIRADRERRMKQGGRHERVRVSMLGTIQVGAAGQETAPIRGVRIRTLLGLMVADQMIGASLTPQEFVLLAGEDQDPELARKKRNMGVVRLREIMGADAVLTDGRTPRLNLEIVDVDLLRADDLIKRSIAAARSGAWVRAHPQLLEALEITAGEVPFPTLYEGFFEAAREDFEFRLRTAVIDISRGLLREGDAGGAEEILRRGFAAMPDDQEIAELLQEALLVRGARVEAERIRLRMKAVAG